MERRGFLGRMVAATGVSLVPVVKGVAQPQHDGPHIFVSKYKGLRVQVTTEKAAQFKNGMFVTNDPEMVEKLRSAVMRGLLQNQGGKPYVWEKTGGS